MDHDFRVEVRGERACFTMPAFGVERRSYPYPTPSAMRGLLEAVFWKPEFRFEIVRIGIIEPGTQESITRSEIRTQQTLRGVGAPKRTLRTTGYLRGVAYLVDARIVPLPHAISSNPHKTYLVQMLRRLQRGAHFQTPYLGIREFAATVRLADPETQPDTTLNDHVGPVFFDNAYIADSKELTFLRKDADGVHEIQGRTRPMFFDMKVEDGWINIPRHLYEDILLLEGRNAA
jgi:CRISPR-associated protein Cas5d